MAGLTGHLFVHIRALEMDRQVVYLAHGLGVLVEVAGIGFQVNDSVRFEELAVTLQEERRRQAGILGTSELGVGEGEPNLGNFFRAEERVDELNSRSQERHIGQGILRGILGAFPQAGALDVHANVVDIRVPEGQGYGIVPFSAAQFQNDGIAVTEHLLPPMALDGVVVELELLGAGLLGQHGRCIRLQQAAEGLVLGKFLEFSVSHQSLCFLITRPIPRSGSSCARSSARMVRVHIPGSAGRTSAL